MDGGERPVRTLRDDPEGQQPANEYQAIGRVGSGSDSRTRLVAVILVAIIGFGLTAAVVGGGRPVPASLIPGLVPTSGPTSALVSGTPAPTAPFLAGPIPSGPVPMLAGSLRWLDPALGGFSVAPADPPPADEVVPDLTFADGRGNVVQVCPQPIALETQRSLGIDVCWHGRGGTDSSRLGLGSVPLEIQLNPDGRTVWWSVRLDAAVARSGRWLWVATAWRDGEAWLVSVQRVDLESHSIAGERLIRRIPIVNAQQAQVGQGWLVADTSIVQPVVRASPDGARLSLTMTEIPAQGASRPLLRQERVVLNSSLAAGSVIDMAFPIGSATDLACDATRSAWATPNHYVTLCSRGDTSGQVQPFVRIENPDDITRDVAIGPLVWPTPAVDDSSWLLDGDQGVLYRWSFSRGLLSTLNVVTRASSTVGFARHDLPQAGAGAPGNAGDAGSVPWSSLGGGGASPVGSLRLAGSPDGRLLYAIGVAPGDATPGDSGQLQAPRPVIWAIEADTARVTAAWDAPAQFDQLVVGPENGVMVGTITPAAAPASGPVVDWSTQVWFLDARTGSPLRLGEVRGPGRSMPSLLPAAVAAFAGFKGS